MIWRVLVSLAIQSHALCGGFHPAPEHFRHTPGLCDTPTRCERLLSIEDLADRTESCLIQLRDKTLEQVARSSPVLGVHPQPCIDKGPDEPGPYCPLMVRRITRAQVAIVLWLVIRMAWGKRAQPYRGEEVLAYHGDDPLPACLVEDRMAQREGEHLVRAAGGILTLRAVDDIVQVSTFGVPEPGVEGRPCLLCVLGQVACGLVSLLLAHPLCEQAQGVIPEGVDLHGLATSWRHHPIAYFGVHPGQLEALLPLLQEAIVWIDVNAKMRAAQVVLDNVQQCREDQPEGGTILCHLEVAVDGMEEPECRVSGMIQALLSTFREHVWHQTVADVSGKGAQDPARLGVTPGDQGEPFEADHGIAAPIVKPVVTSDDGAHLVASRMGPGRILDTPRGRDDALIRSQDELCGDVCLGQGMGGGEQAP